MTALVEIEAPPFGPRDAGIPMTPDAFEAADFELGYRYEVVHGVLVVTPAPLEEERDANEELGRWLRNYGERHPDGQAFNLTLPEQDIRTATQIRRCDRAIWCGLGRQPRTRGAVARRDAPAILVEFPSSRPADQRRDYEEKQVEYRDLGVQEYWIIDRFRRSMAVYSWRGKKGVKRAFRQNEVYETPLLPGFKLELRKLLRVADKYSK